MEELNRYYEVWRETDYIYEVLYSKSNSQPTRQFAMSYGVFCLLPANPHLH